MYCILDYKNFKASCKSIIISNIKADSLILELIGFVIFLVGFVPVMLWSIAIEKNNFGVITGFMSGACQFTILVLNLCLNNVDRCKDL